VADTKNSYFIVKIPVVLLFTFHREYCISHRGNDNHAEKFLMMGHSRYSHVFNFAILLKSQKLDAREIFIFYSVTLFFYR